MRISRYFYLLFFGWILVTCGPKNAEFDATGTFEATEILISSEASGVIKSLRLEEGQVLQAGEIVGYVDSVQLHLRKKQIQAQIEAILSRKPNVSVQLASLQEQLKTAEKEQQRLSNLVKADAATTKQLDDVLAQIEVLKKQLNAQKSALDISVNSIKRETEPLEIQIEQIQDQLNKCVIKNPINGTVLAKYAEENELTAPGKPIFKIADMSNLILRVYVSGDVFAKIKLNQAVTIKTDDGEGGMRTSTGEIMWISDKAEFTPKTIQTKDERAHRVFAVKVRVQNSGEFKIGQYGEVTF